MINITNDLQFFVQGKAIDISVSNAISRAIEILEPHRGRSSSAPTFGRLLSEVCRSKGILLDNVFLGAALEFCMADSRNINAGDSLTILRSYMNNARWSALSLPGLKRGLKLVLIELWRQKVLLIPTAFAPGSYCPMESFEHELLSWVRGFGRGSNSAGAGKFDGERLYFWGPRVLFAADWQRPEDVSLNEVAALHRAQVLYRNGVSDTVVHGSLPCSIFANMLRRAFPGRVSFTDKDLKKYSLWVLGKHIEKVAFEEFQLRKTERKPQSKRDFQSTRRGDGKPGVDHEALVADASKKGTHDAILKVYESLQKGRPKTIDWQQADFPSYPGREHVDMTTLAPLWIRTFRAFLHHRKYVKEYRSNDEAIASLNLLADYLFFYLPWWNEIISKAAVPYPTSPRNFSRYVFVSRHADVSIEELPEPLLHLVALRRPNKDSTWAAVNQLAKYFEFVGTHFAEDEEVAGRGFTSPISKDFDTPRLKRRNKTTKEIIPKQLYGHLLFYCYALEEFGVHLQCLALKGELSATKRELSHARSFISANFGHVPIVKYHGKEFGVESVPNVFTWVNREVGPDKPGEADFVYMPHLTALRLLITSLETGLRCQSVQWLDRVSWDSLNKEASQDCYTYRLLVNTDKTREHAWTTYIVHRVRALLQREQMFQESLSDANRFGPVSYERSENSPFDPIRPLFRAPTVAYPVSDEHYAEIWTELMVYFEGFYRAVTGEQHVRMYRIRPKLHADGTPAVQFFRRDGREPYCPISVLAIHTPHACRATFATNRQGVLELSDTAELLGHRSVVVTAHYTKPSGDALQERLRESDLEIVSEFAIFDPKSDLHIRADRPESALVKSFSRDRDGTVQRFHFMPPIALWSTENIASESEGLKMLREGPMSRIRFRETHICPVGEECPGDIIQQIGAPKRCGACPLAMKCVDHLPAIAAKKNQLLERIKYLHSRRALLEESGEPTAVLDEVWEELELDINEFLGWQLSEEVLTALLKNIEHDEIDGKFFHVDRPEIVRRHLQRVSRRCNSAEFLLQRIADSNAYPSLTTPQVQAAAAQLKRRLLAGKDVREIPAWTGDADDVRATAKQLMFMMKTEGLSMSELAKMLTAEIAAPVKPMLLCQEG